MTSCAHAAKSLSSADGSSCIAWIVNEGVETR